MKNIDIDIDMDKDNIENIDIDIDIDKTILKDILGKKNYFFNRFKTFSCFFDEISI